MTEVEIQHKKGLSYNFYGKRGKKRKKLKNSVTTI
jgi:hypothetical protein